MEEKENEVIKEVNTVKEAEIVGETANSNGNGYSIASMVLGIVGIFFAGVICGILAIVFAVNAKKKKQNKGMTTTGMVLGIIDVSLGAVFLIFWSCGVLFYSFA